MSNIRRLLSNREKTCIALCSALFISLGLTFLNPELLGIYAICAISIGMFSVYWWCMDMYDMFRLRKLLYPRCETFWLCCGCGISSDIYNMFLRQPPVYLTTWDYVFYGAILLLLFVYLPIYDFGNIKEDTAKFKQDIMNAIKDKKEARKAWTVVANNILNMRKEHRDILQ